MNWEVLSVIGGFITAASGAYVKVIKPMVKAERERKKKMCSEVR